MKKQRQFLSFLFSDKSNQEFITLQFAHKETGSIMQRHCKTIEECLSFINQFKFTHNVYVNLACTDGKGRASDNQTSRNVIAFDFDKKMMGDKFNHKDIINIFKKAGLYYHMLVSSGNGYHVYIQTSRTKDIEKLIDLNKALGKRVGADIQALSSTQILRVPATFNFKDAEHKKSVSLMWKAEKILPLDMEKLYKKYVFNTSLEATNLKYVRKENMPPCITALLEGVVDGERNFALGRLTAHFKRWNYSKASTWQLIKEWNLKCMPPEDENKLKINFNNYWSKDYKLLGCVCDDGEIQSLISKYCNKIDCNKADKYEVIHVDKTVQIEYKVAENMRKRGNKPMLDGNHIAVISILKVHGLGLNTKQLEQELTSTITHKCCMSKPTRIKVLRELEEMGVIECIKSSNKTVPNLYKIKDIKCLENEKFVMSYQAVQRYLDGAIGKNALKIYSFMRYRVTRGENVVQEQMGRELDITQQAVGQAIKELEKARFLNIHTDYSINPLGANVYEWIY